MFVFFHSSSAFPQKSGRAARAGALFLLIGMLASVKGLPAQVASSPALLSVNSRLSPLLFAALSIPGATSNLPDAPSALLASPSESFSSGWNGSPENSAAATSDSSEPADDRTSSLPSGNPSFSDSGPADGNSFAQEMQDAAPKKLAAGQQPASGQQPKRILGLMPNYRSVSAGVIPPPPTFRQNFKVATRQAFDYSSFVFLGITSGIAEAEDAHPSIDTVNGGHAVFYAYTWRGFLDKTDGTYQSAWILPTLLREDTRYYALGTGSKWRRLGYAASRVAIARTYGGHTTVNFAGLGGKAGAQVVSRYYYPPGATSFGVLATKFAYACARDMGFTVFREFYPDIAVHILHRSP